jgi:hypothetical protein
VRVVLDEKLLLVLEEVVDVLDRAAEEELVARLLERADQANQLLLLVLAANVQVLVVFQENVEIAIAPEISILTLNILWKDGLIYVNLPEHRMSN